MALKVGSLYASLSANTAAFGKAMDGALKSLDRFAKEAKRISNDVAAVGGVLGGIGIAAVKLASTVDGPTANAMGNLEKSTKLLAVQVADVLLPAVNQMTAMFKGAAAAVAGLDPHVKAQISNFALIAVQVAAAAKVFGMLSSVLSSTIGIARGLFSLVFSPLGAALVTVVALVVLLHRAWRKNWFGIQETTASVLEWLKDAFSQLAGFFAKVWDFIIDGAGRFVESILDVIDTIQKLTGKKVVDTAGLREGFAGLWKDLKSGDFFANAFKFGKTVGGEIVDGIAEELAVIKAEISSALGFGGGPAKGTPIGLGRGMGGPARQLKTGFITSGAVEARSLAGAAQMNGGGSFLEEMRQLARATDKQAKDLARAAAAEMRARFATAQDAVNARKLAKASATGDLTGLSRSERRTVTADPGGAWADLTKAQQNFKNGLKRAWGLMSNSLGAMGEVANSIAQGAQAGGIWGALIAAVLEVFKRMASFQKLLGIWEYGLKRLGEFLEPLLSGIFDFIGQQTALGTEMLGPLFKALKPLFDGIVNFLKGMTPSLVYIGKLFEMVAPIIEFVATVVGKILEALKPVTTIVNVVIKAIVSVVAGIVIALNSIAAAFGDTKAQAEVKKYQDLVNSMWSDSNDDAAQAYAAQIDSTWQVAAANNAAADSANAAAEAFTNVPSGYKMALAQYNADLGLSFAGTTTTSAAGGGSTTVINGDVNVASSAEDLQGMIDDARKERTNRHSQQSGSRQRGTMGDI